MPSTLNFIPNSPGVSSVLSLFSYCFTFLKNARPLSHSAHAVTSLITPQAGASLSSKLSPLLVGGTIFALGAVSLIAARLIFRKPPPSSPPPETLSGRAKPIIPPDQSHPAVSGTEPPLPLPPPPNVDLSRRARPIIPPDQSHPAVSGTEPPLPLPPPPNVDLSRRARPIIPPAPSEGSSGQSAPASEEPDNGADRQLPPPPPVVSGDQAGR